MPGPEQARLCGLGLSMAKHMGEQGVYVANLFVNLQAQQGARP
jgi:hypothetical protein